MTETHKMVNGISLPVVGIFFILQNNTHRNFQEISIENRKTLTKMISI